MSKEAQGGSAEAQYQLGQRYDKGQGVPQDYKEAAKWTRLAAEQGYAQAQNSMGFRYFHGTAVPQDYKEAAKWFRLSAEQGHETAQNNLAVAMKEIEKLERPKKFKPRLLAMEKSRFLECDAFMGNLRAETLFFDGTYDEDILVKELRVYASVVKSRQIAPQEIALAGGKLFKELKKTYGSDKLKKLMYLDRKTIECGGESKQIAEKQFSPKQKGFALLMLAKKCTDSALIIRKSLSSQLRTSITFFEHGEYQASMDISRRILRMGRDYGESNCHE